MNPLTQTGCLTTVFILTGTIFFTRQALAFEAMYDQTRPGTIEVKTLPERVALQAGGTGAYFGEDNGLFRTLFKYIKSNEVSMTVPVEAEVEHSAMRFFAGRKDLDKALKDGNSVSVVNMPERTVVSIGMRGTYNQKNFNQGAVALASWLRDHPEYSATGAAYAVYWNGPYLPGFLKRSEVHIPVAPSASANTASPTLSKP